MSSKKLLLPILLLAVLGGGAAFFLMGDGGGDSGGANEILAPLERGGETVVRSDPKSDLETPTVVAAERDDTPEPVERVEAPPVERTSFPGSIWVEGRVVFPADTPADEVVTVIARGKKFKGKQEDENRFEAQAQSNGRFRVAFAKGTTRGRITIRARYLYMTSTTRVRIKEHEGDVVLEPSLGGAIEVDVARLAGQPLTEEELDAITLKAVNYDGNGPAFQRSSSDREGTRYLIGGLEPSPSYNLGLESKRFVDINRSGIGVAAGEVATLELEVDEGARLTGVIVDAEGEPVPKAQITIQGQSLWERETAEEDGTFDLAGLPAGSVSLEVRKDGFEETEQKFTDLQTGQHIADLELVLGRGNTITGIVTWPDGSPATGAKVVLREENDTQYYWRSDDRSVEVDEEGRFEISGLDDTKIRVLARARQKVAEIEGESKVKRRRRQRTAPYWHARLDDVDPGTTGLTLILRAGSVVRGKVVDDLGNPLERFRVTAIPSGDGPWNGANTGRVSSSFKDSVDGSFTLEGLKDGKFEVYGSASGHESVTVEEVEIPWDGREVELVLPREASIAGFVYDLEGKPVVGAVVEQDYENASRGYRFRTRDRETKTKDDGSFRLKGLAPGKMALHAEAAGFADSKPFALELNAAEDRTDVSLTMRTGGRITGRIHPSVGNVADRRVSANGSNGGTNWSNTQSDANGEFAFEGLNPGRYQISFEPDMSDVDQDSANYGMLRRSRSSRESVELAEGGDVRVTLGSPPDAPIVVTGRVTSGGEGVPDLIVRVSSNDEKLEDQDHAATTDSNGTYTVTVDGAGRYRFNIGRGWGRDRSYKRDVPAENARFDFELPGASVAGTIRGPGGDVVVGVEVTLTLSEAAEESYDGSLSTQSTQTDDEGRYTFENLPAGTFTIRAGGQNRLAYVGSDRKAFGRIVVSGIEVEADKKTERDIDLRPAGKIEGIILDSAGNPVAGLWVQASTEGGESLQLWGSRSNQAGKFTVRGLGAGKVELSVSTEDRGACKLVTTVFEDQTTEVEMLLQ